MIRQSYSNDSLTTCYKLCQGSVLVWFYSILVVLPFAPNSHLNILVTTILDYSWGLAIFTDCVLGLAIHFISL